jgi:hypothetical protein
MAGFFLLGFPLVAYVWHVLNHVIAGRVYGREVFLGLIAAALLLGILRLMGRAIHRFDAARAAEIGRNPPPSHGGPAHA